MIKKHCQRENPRQVQLKVAKDDQLWRHNTDVVYGHRISGEKRNKKNKKSTNRNVWMWKFLLPKIPGRWNGEQRWRWNDDGDDVTVTKMKAEATGKSRISKGPTRNNYVRQRKRDSSVYMLQEKGCNYPKRAAKRWWRRRNQEAVQQWTSRLMARS